MTKNQPIVDKVGKGKRVPVGSCVALQCGERILCSVYFYNTNQQTPAKMSEDKPKVSIRFVIVPYFKALRKTSRVRPSSSFILCSLAESQIAHLCGRKAVGTQSLYFFIQTPSVFNLQAYGFIKACFKWYAKQILVQRTPLFSKHRAFAPVFAPAFAGFSL